ncbi:hypothetical protein NM208_g3560 [Fusarium decemcellulare]|uniref:Uncharacterized protein n=1 Tax=Fusarium decemcellulare TaxID=57161 RepID=A0ACC1SNQ2_9HYPO|nr:hypothetical protein NM208_g3560 [Fusarium decemcellulare]
MPTRKLKETERRRCANACYTCKRRKERCDGRRPCGRCSARGVGTECSFAPPSAATRSTQDMSPERLDRVFEGPSQDHSQASISPEMPPSIDLFDEASSQPRCGPREDLNPENPNNGAPVPQLSRLIQDGHGKFIFIGDAANLSFLQIIRRLVRDSVGPCAFTEDPLRHLMVEATPSSNSNWIIEIVRNRPTKPRMKEAHYFLSWYLRSTSCVLNLFDEQELSQSLTRWIQVDPDGPDQQASEAVFFLIFAIGAQTCPEDEDKKAEQYFNYGRFLTASIVMEDISISAVQSNILITMYLLGASRRNAAFMYLGSAVRAAYALGIQRRDINKLFSQSEYLLCERLWKVLRVLDLFMSASLGRTPSTHETRDTGFDKDYSASNDLCAIFEDILTDIYSQRKVTADALERISEHHRQWSSRFASGLATDSIKPAKFLDIDGQQTPNIGLCHLKEAYYWTIMLLARPFLIESTTRHMSRVAQVLNQCETPRATHESDQVLALSCVDSAVRTVDLLGVVGMSQQVPKRLPFVVNSLSVAALVLGLAYFSDLDRIFPLDKSMAAVCSLMGRFSTHDAVARRTLQIIENLQTACNLYIDARARRKMERQSLLVRNLFGTVHDGSARQSPAPENCESASGSISMEECSDLGQFEHSVLTWPLGCEVRSASGLDGEITSMIPHSALEAFSLPTPRTIAFESFDSSIPLFPTVDVSTLGMEQIWQREI